MAKQKQKNPLSDFLKQVKQNTKAIVKQLKELKKTARPSVRYDAVIQRALELYENGGTLVTAYRDSLPKVVVVTPAEAAKAPAKKVKEKAAAKKKKK